MVLDWLIRGRTILIPKEGSNGELEKYRPITCLNIVYKLMMGMLTEMLACHVMQRSILPREGTGGCLDAIIVDEAMTTGKKYTKRNLSVVWDD